MSTWTEADKVSVTIKAGNPATEISIIDGNFGLVEQGLDHLETRLSPGLYKIKFKSGSTIKEQHQVVTPGSSPIRVTGPEISFPTSAPLSQTSTSHEFHQGPAVQLSREVHRRLGHGSQFFFFGRDLEPQQAPKNVATGLSLCSLAGETLVDLARQSVHNAEQSWAGCTVEVDPGIYRLRLQAGEDMTLEQILVASLNWQTQVFWLRRDYGPGRPVRRVDLADASLLMARIGLGFDPNRDDLRTTDLARQGLVNRRAVVSAAELNQLLWGKFQNPMFGIFGAHLLLLGAEPDLAVLGTVVTNLRHLVGEHPDVEALALRLGETVSGFASPPMLRSSWRQIVQASAASPELVPAGSLAAQVADRLWGEGAWLVWERPPTGEAAGVKEGTTRGALSVSQTLSQVVDTVAGPENLEAFLTKGELTDLEESLLRYALKTNPAQAKSASLESLRDQPGTEADLIRTLGLPYAAIQQSLAGLSQKVEQLAASRGVSIGDVRGDIRSSIIAGGDVVGSTTDISGSGNVLIQGSHITAGSHSVIGATARGDINTGDVTTGRSGDPWAGLFGPLYRQIEANSRLSADDKADLKADVEEIEKEAKAKAKAGAEPDDSLVRRRLRSIEQMAPDLIEAIAATTVSPASDVEPVWVKIVAQAGEIIAARKS
ncbi:MAG: hypothetical protein KJ077_27245 [Anaerolineae bacterium]|nr:hypothetical protein [Anaerolineae bacterium]